MPRRGISRRCIRLGAVPALAGVLVLAGCSSTGGFFSGGNRGGDGTSEPAGDNRATAGQATASLDTGGLAVYLDTMQRLAEGDALTRAEAFNEARDSAEFAPTTTNRLRYALALAVPGHPGSDADAAAERLRSLIAAGDALLPEERMLAQIELHQVERLIILESQIAEARSELETAVETRDAEHAARVGALQAENQRLQQELKDTTAMLQAITSIEQSISEREDP